MLQALHLANLFSGCLACGRGGLGLLGFHGEPLSIPGLGLGDPLLGFVKRLGRLPLEVRENLVDVRRVFDLENEEAALAIVVEGMLDGGPVQFLVDELPDGFVFRELLELSHAELRPLRRVFRFFGDGVRGPCDLAARVPEGVCEPFGACRHRRAARILPDSQHPVDELLAGVVPVVAWHSMPPFSKFPGLSGVVGSLSVLSCGIERC